LVPRPRPLLLFVLAVQQHRELRHQPDIPGLRF
jgi:hypothetical protein